MPAPLEIFLTTWTARLAVACYVARLAFDAAGRSDVRGQRLARWVWTAGLACFLLHLAAAFQFYHHWSHAAAWEHVRSRTLAMTGWDSGVGLSVNYAFTGLWLVDCALWWRSLSWSQQRAAYWTVQAAFAFLMLNATLVFGPRGWLVAGPVAIAVLVLLAVRSRRCPAEV